MKRFTGAMQGGRTSGTMGRGNGRTGRKPVESFVSWKKTSDSVEQQTMRRPSLSKSRGRGMGRAIAASNMFASAQSPSVSQVPSMSAGEDTFNAASESTRTLGRQSTTIAGRQHGRVGGRGWPLSREEGQVSSNGESSCKRSLDSVTRTVPREIFNRSISRRFVVLKNVGGGGEVLPKLGREITDDVVYADTVEAPSSSGVETFVEHETVGEEDEEYREDGLQLSQPRPQELAHDVALFNENPNDTFVTNNDGEGDNIDGEDEVGDDGEDDQGVMQEFVYPTNVQIKKDRRQERAWLNKEGEKRQAEGKPRNFLLVDERTGMPYGVGVGDWRKELMLLSRDLDPAIGNINRQPEGAVAEIADWIQHTWEYSSPPKLECVKEVIARGVTLRRVDLWKKIRNGERKPTEVSDRTWLTLEKQLENPASIRKSENCRKANASRVNFGRTGPSGEVGLRHRMKRILRRSPNPDEVRFEMARDKGFTKRQRLNENDVDVIQVTGSYKIFSGDVPRICAGNENVQEDCYDGQVKGTPNNFSDEEEGAIPVPARQGDKVSGRTISAMSVEEISEHPFVAMMMERLQALEEKQNTSVSIAHRELGHEIRSPGDAGEGNGGQQAFLELQKAVDFVDLQGGQGSRTSARLKNKVEGR